MARLTEEELENIRKKYNVSRIWSWSRVSTFMTSPYEYFLHYVLNKKEDRADSCYVGLGTICHDALDKFYEGEIQYEDMIEYYNDGFLTIIDLAGLKFDRSNEDKNKSIGQRYNDNLKCFFTNHTVYKHKLLIEKPVTIKVGNNVFVGYIDALFKDDNGCINIIDFKSSSIYTGKTLEEHSGQLCLYALGLHQQGIPLEKLKVCFNFLKYVTVEYTQANNVVKTRNIERHKLGESLSSNCGMWLKKLGYENEVDDYLKLLIDTNDIKCLPELVQEKYKTYDCHVFIDLTEDLINKWIDTIKNVIVDISLREHDYEETGSDKCFWDSEESVEKQSYYMANLMAYSPNLHLPYKEYLEKREEAKKGMDLFSGVGSDAEDVVTTKVINNKSNEVDLSWLDSI